MSICSTAECSVRKGSAATAQKRVLCDREPFETHNRIDSLHVTEIQIAATEVAESNSLVVSTGLSPLSLPSQPRARSRRACDIGEIDFLREHQSIGSTGVAAGLFGDIGKVTRTSKAVGYMTLMLVADDLKPDDVINPM